MDVVARTSERVWYMVGEDCKMVSSLMILLRQSDILSNDEDTVSFE